MKEMRKRNIASLVINLAIVLFTIECFSYSFRNDVIREPEWLGFDGIHSLRFFTVLSNIFVAIIAVITIIYTIKNLINDSCDYPKWLIVAKHTATVAVALTFTTVALLLAPTYAFIGKGYFKLFSNNNFYMHFLTPVLAIVSFAFFECSHKISFKNTLWSLIPVSLYSILYFIMVVVVGETKGGWPDFYNFTFGGHNWAIPISVVAMLTATFVLSILIAKWHNKNCEKIQKEI